MHRTKLMAWLAAATLGAASTAAFAQAEQFVPLLSYRVGAYAAGGSGIFGGYIDYMNYINMKEGGVNGVKLSWEECEKNTKERAWKYRFEKPDEFFEWLHDKRPRSFERYTKQRRQMLQERARVRKSAKPVPPLQQS